MVDVTSILITGATGYLGSNLVDTFIDNGYKVAILKRKSSNTKRIEHLLDKIKIYDIENVNYKDVIESNNIDLVVHTAASYGRKGESLSSIYDANLFFPVKLLEACIAYNVKYFFNSNTTLPSNLNNYSLSKKQFSDILKINSAGLKVVDIELQYFYGPGDDNSKFITYIISKILNDESSIDLSAGEQIRDFIFIKDVTEAFVMLTKRIGDFPGHLVVPLGTGNGIPLKTLTEKIKDAISDSKTKLNFGALPMRPGEIMYSVANTEFLNKLGWKPQYNIDQGLLETIAIEKKSQHDYNKQ